MKTIEKMLFRLQRCAILQTKINPQTNSFISDDYAYAWYSSVYPLFDENEMEDSFKKSEINRDQLIPILRYVHLGNDKFDQKFWDVLLTSGECPDEAKGIISEFDILDTIKVNLL